MLKDSLQHSKLKLMQSWHIGKANKQACKRLLRVCASSTFRQFERVTNCRFCPFSCSTEVQMDCLHPSQQVCPKYSGSGEGFCPSISMNALLVLLTVSPQRHVGIGIDTNFRLFCRDAIAEHNTDRCYVTKTEGMPQFPDVKPHPSVSLFDLSEILRL